MAKEKNTVEHNLLPAKLTKVKDSLLDLAKKHKKIVIASVFIVLIVFVAGFTRVKKNNVDSAAPKVITAKIDKSFDFSALNNQGKPVYNTKIKFRVVSSEKTNQVTVKDQVYTAKNNKLFLIVNLELKNDASSAYNILPGDLVRLTYNSDSENKYAPDLHNNLVNVAAISTKIDRIGFVIPDNAKDFKLYIGELEGKKETVSVDFPS